MQKIAIIDGVRSPCCKFQTLLKNINAADLAMHVIRELIERTGIDEKRIDHVIFGCGGPPADAPNIARNGALQAGIPAWVPAYTVQRNCASGLQSISDACMLIETGRCNAVIAGGVESMTHIPLFYPRVFQEKLFRFVREKTIRKKLKSALSFRLKDFKPQIGIEIGLTDSYCGLNMGETAEILAKTYNISREAQDELALSSHLRTTAAWKEGRFNNEVMTIYNPRGNPPFIDRDNGHRPDQTLEDLARLKPYFDRRFGTVTPGNSSQITDGASALLLMDADLAKAEGFAVKAFVRSWAYAGCDPKTMGLGPAFSTPLALGRAGLSLKDMGLVELNEAFAAQVIANEIAFSSRTFSQEAFGNAHPIGELDRSIMNVNGGAISLGHPVGASGNRITLTLMKEMERRDVEFGLATLCIGGGQGGAMILERS
jgi:acetyl-CoA acyltransferase